MGSKNVALELGSCSQLTSSLLTLVGSKETNCLQEAFSKNCPTIFVSSGSPIGLQMKAGSQCVLDESFFSCSHSIIAQKGATVLRSSPVISSSGAFEGIEDDNWISGKDPLTLTMDLSTQINTISPFIGKTFTFTVVDTSASHTIKLLGEGRFKGPGIYSSDANRATFHGSSMGENITFTVINSSMAIVRSASSVNFSFDS